MKKYLFFWIFSLYCFLAFSQAGWHAIDAPLDGNDHGAVFTIDENVVHMVLDNGRLLKTEDGGENWTTFETGVLEHFFDLGFYGENLGLAVGANGSILKTTDGGTTWTSINSGTSNHLFSLDFRTETEVWAVGENGIVLRSVNSGNSWTNINLPLSQRLNSIRFKDANIGLIAGNDGVLYKTINGGVNWEVLNIEYAEDLFSISITENFYIISSGYTSYDYVLDRRGYSIYVSGDLEDWEQKSFFDIKIMGNSSCVYFYNDNIGFLLWGEACLCDECYLQILKSDNLGENWEIDLDILTNAANCISSSAHYAGIDFATQYTGYALYEDKLFKTTDIISIEEVEFRNKVSIYPNPSDDIIHISVSDITEDIQIKIFDVSGKEVLIAEIIENDTSMDVSSLNAGMYFVKIQKKSEWMEVIKFIKK